MTKAEYVKSYCIDDETRRNNWLRVIELLPAHSYVWKMDTGCLLGYRLVIRLRTLDDLHEVRQALYAALGSWEDRLDQVWSSCGNIMASWKNEKNDSVVIWLETSPENFPPELLKPGCEIVKEEHTETEYSVVCDIGSKK